MLGFTLLLTVVVALLLSYSPTDQGERAWRHPSQGGKRTTGGSRRQRLQQSLVVAQIAVSVVLLTGAGLLTRTMQRLSVVDDGLTGDNLLTLQVPPDYTQPQTMSVALYERIQSQVAAIPGVKEVALGSTVPLRSEQFALDIKAEGRPLAPGEAQPRAEGRTRRRTISGSPHPLLKGREFQSTDREGSDSCHTEQDPRRPALPGPGGGGPRVAWTGEVLKFIGIPENSGAPSSVWSATPRTVASTPRRLRFYSARSRKPRCSPAVS